MKLNLHIQMKFSKMDFQNYVQMDIKKQINTPHPHQIQTPGLKGMSCKNSGELPRTMCEGKKFLFSFFILQLHLNSMRRGCSELTHGTHISKLKLLPPETTKYLHFYLLIFPFVHVSNLFRSFTRLQSLQLGISIISDVPSSC